MLSALPWSPRVSAPWYIDTCTDGWHATSLGSVLEGCAPDRAETLVLPAVAIVLLVSASTRVFRSGRRRELIWALGLTVVAALPGLLLGQPAGVALVGSGIARMTQVITLLLLTLTGLTGVHTLLTSARTWPADPPLRVSSLLRHLGDRLAAVRRNALYFSVMTASVAGTLESALTSGHLLRLSTWAFLPWALLACLCTVPGVLVGRAGEVQSPGSGLHQRLDALKTRFALRLDHLFGASIAIAAVVFVPSVLIGMFDMGTEDLASAMRAQARGQATCLYTLSDTNQHVLFGQATGPHRLTDQKGHTVQVAPGRPLKSGPCLTPTQWAQEYAASAASGIM